MTDTVAIACSACPSGTLVETDDQLGEHCTGCSYDSRICNCGIRMEFDPQRRGVTCGGLALVGWMVCSSCSGCVLCPRSRPADAVDWVLAKSGRSLTAGAVKVRAEAAEPGAVEAVLARIVRVPELELEVERLRAELARRRAA